MHAQNKVFKLSYFGKKISNFVCHPCLMEKRVDGFCLDLLKPLTQEINCEDHQPKKVFSPQSYEHKQMGLKWKSNVILTLAFTIKYYNKNLFSIFSAINL